MYDFSSRAFVSYGVFGYDATIRDVINRINKTNTMPDEIVSEFGDHDMKIRNHPKCSSGFLFLMQVSF